MDTHTDAHQIPDHSEFLEDVIEGLSKPSKTLPCKYFYDERGSQLFDQICEVEEYYLTRTELSLLEEHGEDICASLGPDVALVEPGAGSSIKVRLLLPYLQSPVAYVPVDISQEHLLAASEELQRDFPEIPILPVVADYSTPFTGAQYPRTPRRTVFFYPGSTIGNFAPEEAIPFLERMSRAAGPQGALLIGFDRKKDRATLEAAYNDERGVTRDFHLNLLERINRELGADFSLEDFEHSAFFNEAQSRIEMHLVSTRAQQVEVGGQRFSFEEGETICTEYSYKYTPEAFVELAQQAGFSRSRLWTDPAQRFALMLLEVAQ